MKKIIITIIISSVSFLGCSNEKKAPEELVNETPDAIEESSSYDISSYSGRGWNENIIERLFNEAVDKNNEVAVTAESIQIANDIYNDSLKEFNKYISINEDYWKTANDYIARISDSTLRKSIKDTFEKSEIDYCDLKKNLTSLNDKITVEKKRLEDQVTILKLIVTLPMIQNYQKNEKPDSLKLKEVINSLENTNKEINVFTHK